MAAFRVCHLSCQESRKAPFLANGQLLFVLFINDIVDEIDDNAKILLYADDLNIFRQIFI